MRAIKKWRYYCDHCKKSGCSSYHMKRHEEKCMLNPSRHCGICDSASPREELFSYVNDLLIDEHGDVLWHTDTKRKDIISQLVELSEGCHACIRSALRIKGKFFDFGYDEMRLKHWSAVNAEFASIAGFP